MLVGMNLVLNKEPKTFGKFSRNNFSFHDICNCGSLSLLTMCWFCNFHGKILKNVYADFTNSKDQLDKRKLGLNE